MKLARGMLRRSLFLRASTRIQPQGRWKMSTTVLPSGAAMAPTVFRDHGQDNKSSWFLALVASAAVAGSASLTTLCEVNKNNHPHDPPSDKAQVGGTLQEGPTKPKTPVLDNDDPKFQRFRTEKKGIRDPMTSYAKYAIERELKEEESREKPNSPQENVKEEGALQPPQKQQEEMIQDPALLVQATSVASGEQLSIDMSSTPGMTQSEARIEEATRKAKQHSGGLKIFSGNGNMSLALEVTRHLGVNLGKATVGKFADGEVNVVIHENVRGKDVYVVQPTGPPVNDNLMELLLIVSTLRRSSARRITVVIPYYGYARQDRKMQARVPISAADVARLMEAMGIDRVIAVDLHCGQIQGFFGPRVPVDNLDGGIVGLDYFGCKDLHNPVIVSPDAGGVYRAKKFKEGLEQKYDMQDLGLAMIVKQRARAGSVDQMDLVGDVRDCDCIIVDDMIDTAGTLCKAADVLLANGARRVFAFATHGLLSGPGNERIANSGLSEVVILNTLPSSAQREANEKLTELSVAPLLAQAIFNIHAKKSISALFK